MSHPLPTALTAALEALLEGVSRRDLAERSARLTAEYRKSGAARLTDRLDHIAYAVARMPATFAAVSAALGWTMPALGDWQPRTLLDLGSGPGTSIWAAREWFAGLEAAIAIERDRGMIGLAADLPPPDLRISRMDADLGSGAAVSMPRSDLVIASYVLGELVEGAGRALVERAWEACSGVMLLVEPGTPSGARKIGAARAQLIAAGAHILAPCPNALACPMAAPDWCHFSARLPRSRAHMQIKSADVPFEDEKFAYLAAARFGSRDAMAGRIVAPVAVSKPGAELTVCQDGGISQIIVARRDASAFRQARKRGWGDPV